jgi:hypothetical protein
MWPQAPIFTNLLRQHFEKYSIRSIAAEASLLLATTMLRNGKGFMGIGANPDVTPQSSGNGTFGGGGDSTSGGDTKSAPAISLLK